MPRLPAISENPWGEVLNDYLAVGHGPEGEHRFDCPTLNELRALNVSHGSQAIVSGYGFAGDGGGGTFYYDENSSDADNDGTIITPSSGSGRWKRVYYGEVNARAFGLIGDGSDETPVLQRAIDALAPLGVLLHIPSGTYRCKDVLVRAGTTIRGAGRSTVLKLLDGSGVGNHVLKCASTVSGIDNVYIGHLTVDGNEAAIGLSDLSMHGILILGQHNNWTIEHVTAQNTCGDGIAVSTPNGGEKPTNIRILNVHVSNTKRQDIGIVRAIGVTVSDCSGTGRLDLEVNAGDGAALYATTVTNCRFNEIYVVGRGAEGGGFLKNNFALTGLFAETRFHMWQTANAIVTGLVCGGEVAISECDRVTMSGVVCGNAYIYAPNNYTCRNCYFSDFQISCETDNKPALKVSNAIDCIFDGFDIRSTGTNGDGIQVSNSTAQSAGTLTFMNMNISHSRYGLYCVPTLLDGLTLKLTNSTVNNAGTRAIYSTSGSSLTYGTYIINKCDLYGGVTLQDFLRVDMDQIKIHGDHTVIVKDSRDASIYLGDIEFIRSTAGTSTIDLQSNTTMTSLVIGHVRQRSSGGITATLTSSTFAAGVKAWIDGPVVEATTWASALADADIRPGSMYRLRGNTTNWGYTHNGTAWVAKAH